MPISTKDWFELVFKYRWPAAVFLTGISMIGLGVLFSLNKGQSSESVQVLSASETDSGKVIVEVSGAVSKPGVYELPSGSRVEDAINTAGGFFNENKQWVEQSINRAAKLTDGQKVYVKSASEEFEVDSSREERQINLNTASKSELESLWGIGPVYAQTIIDNRPYSDVNELIDKGVVKQNVFDRNRDKLTVY